MKIKITTVTGKADDITYSLEYTIYSNTRKNRTSYSIFSRLTSDAFCSSDAVEDFTENLSYAEHIYNTVINYKVFPVHIEYVVCDMSKEDPLEQTEVFRR